MKEIKRLSFRLLHRFRYFWHKGDFLIPDSFVFYLFFLSAIGCIAFIFGACLEQYSHGLYLGVGILYCCFAFSFLAFPYSLRLVWPLPFSLALFVPSYLFFISWLAGFFWRFFQWLEIGF